VERFYACVDGKLRRNGKRFRNIIFMKIKMMQLMSAKKHFSAMFVDYVPLFCINVTNLRGVTVAMIFVGGGSDLSMCTCK